MFDRFKFTTSSKSTFKSAISSFGHKMLGLKFSTPPTNLIHPGHNTPVLTYVATLEALNLGVGSNELRKWKVVKVTRLKSKKISRHEYMRASLRDPEEKITYLVFERTVGEIVDPPVTESCPDLTKPRLTRTKSSISSISNSISPEHLAQDVVSPLAKGKWDNGDEVGTLTFKEDNLPTLQEVSLLAGVVHDANPKYLLFSNNCYHYCGTMMRVLDKVYSPVVDIPVGSKAGTWCGIDLSTVHKGNIPALCANFHDKVNNIVSFNYLFSMPNN